MNRYLVSFWADGVNLGYVSVWADSENEAEIKARNERPWRYADPELVAIIRRA